MATKSTWREPLMFLLEFPLLELKQLWKNWTKDEKIWQYLESVHEMLYRIVLKHVDV